MGFWIFMLVMDLLIPVTMVFIGKRFQKKPPKEINGIYGYRTAMSMKNKETWEYAHRCCGKLWYVSGLVMLLPTVIALVCVFGKGNDCVGTIGGIVCMATMYPDGWSNCIDRAGVEKEIRPEWKSAKRLKRDHPPAPENIPELVDDQRSEKDSPPQSGGCSSCKKRAENENQRAVFLSAPFLQEHPCFAGLSFSSSP